MRFFVSRVSLYDDNEKPCEEAFQVGYTRSDIRTVDDPAKIAYFQNFPERIQAEWYGEGTNHRVEDGCIIRDFEDKAWAIDIESFEQLMAFYQKYGNLILRQYPYANEPEIRILDDYL